MCSSESPLRKEYSCFPLGDGDPSIGNRLPGLFRSRSDRIELLFFEIFDRCSRRNGASRSTVFAEESCEAV